MKTSIQAAFAVMALFALTACGGGGGGGSTPVADNNPPPQAQPTTPPANTDPMSPEPLPAPEPIDWRFDSEVTDLTVTWDGVNMSISYEEGRENMPVNAVFPSFVPSTLTFSDGLAWGTIAGDRAATPGSVDIVLRVPTRRMTFDFDFPGTRLDSAGLPVRYLSGWQWQDTDGAGSLTWTNPTNYAPISVYGVEAYDNRAGQEVEAAYWSVVDDGTYGE